MFDSRRKINNNLKVQIENLQIVTASQLCIDYQQAIYYLH